MSATLSRRLKPKIQKAINKYGIDLEVYRASVNEFGEQDEPELSAELKAIYWDKSSYTLKIIEQDDGGATTRQRRPYLTAMYEETLDISLGDYVSISGVKYAVVDKLNVQQLDVAVDLVLEKITN